MGNLSAADIAIVQNRYPEIFRSQRLRRMAPLLLIVGIALYFIYAWAFFAMDRVFAKANWEIAGNYLADWVSYESRPDIDLEDDYLHIAFPRFDPLGNDPRPDWLQTRMALVEKKTAAKSPAPASGIATGSAGFLGAVPQKPETPATGAMGFMGAGGNAGANPAGSPEETTETVREQTAVSATVDIGGALIAVTPDFVSVTRGGETFEFDIARNTSVTPRQPLPAWMQQKAIGGKVTVGLGFPGRVEIEDDAVKIRYRFWGWENFIFDVNSPFWNKPLGEIAALILSGPDLKPGMSNAALAFDNIWNNAEWQHGDVWVKLLQTIVMAFIGTLFASLLAFPLSFIAARNITPNRTVNWLMKRLFDFTRSVDMLIWALFFTRAFGPGPLAGISAIFVTDTGTFGKLYSETLENIDDRQREGIKSVGANPLLVQRYGVIPQVLPVFLSQSLYFWESNTRSATIIGAVGAGGIGLKLWEAMRTNQDWENVAYMVLLILIVVFIFDNISNALRSRLIGNSPSRNH